MISVDFEKLKELYEIVNRFQGSVSENLSRAEAQASGITADGDKLLRHLNEIKRFLDDEISRYQKVEIKLNNKANAITFRGSKALNAVYINNISENIQVRAANVNTEAFIPLALNGDAGLESKSSELKLKSENAVDKSLKAVESEIYKALSDKDLEGLKENGVDLVKIKVEEFFTFDKNESKELSKEEEKYKNNLEEDWDNFKSNIWNEFKKDHPEVVKKLEEIKNQIEVELKTAWNNFKKDYPILAQILKVSYKTVKGIIEGGIDVGKGLVEAPFQLVHLLGQQLYDFKKDPLGTAKKWLTVGGNIYTLLNGMPPLTQEQANFRAGLVQMVRTTIDKNIIHGDAESRSRFVTNVAGNIAIFVFTDGAGASSKAGEAGEVVEEVSNGEKAEEALNTIGKTEDALNTAGKAEDAVSTAGKAESWWSKLEAPLKTFSNFNKEFSKAANTLKACINTKVEEVFTIVKETKDLGKSILYKLRDPVNEVKEIILPKRELTENQERIILEGCFTGETLINTELGLRRIDSIKEGEKVYAEDAKTGEKELKKVLYVYKKHSKDIIIITIGKEKIETTAPHLFYTEEGFKPAERIKAGEKIKNNNGTYKEVIDITARHTEEAIYNLNVEDYHTYFVGESSLLVHNDCSVSNEEVKTVTDAIRKGKRDSEVAGKEAKDVQPSSVKEGEGTEGVSNAELNTCDSIKKIINDKGYSVDEFAQLLHPDRVLSDSERSLVDSVRNEIGKPSSDTLMCKTIPQSDIYKYLYNPDYDGVRGFTAVEEHGANLKTLLDKYNGARLDYNNTAFKTTNGVDGISQSVGLPDKVYGTIEYKANDVSEISIPDWKPKPEDYPYTGKAFTGSTNVVLPEYYQSARKFMNGDKLKILDSKTGDIVQQFIYDEKLGWLELK